MLFSQDLISLLRIAVPTIRYWSRITVELVFNIWIKFSLNSKFTNGQQYWSRSHPSQARFQRFVHATDKGLDTRISRNWIHYANMNTSSITISIINYSKSALRIVQVPIMGEVKRYQVRAGQDRGLDTMQSEFLLSTRTRLGSTESRVWRRRRSVSKAFIDPEWTVAQCTFWDCILRWNSRNNSSKTLPHIPLFYDVIIVPASKPSYLTSP